MFDTCKGLLDPCVFLSNWQSDKDTVLSATLPLHVLIQLTDFNKAIVRWEVTTCSLPNMCRCFEGTFQVKYAEPIFSEASLPGLRLPGDINALYLQQTDNVADVWTCGMEAALAQLIVLSCGHVQKCGFWKHKIYCEFVFLCNV